MCLSIGTPKLINYSHLFQMENDYSRQFPIFVLNGKFIIMGIKWQMIILGVIFVQKFITW